MFVIRDDRTNLFFRKRPADGWYGPLTAHTRIYATREQAQTTIREAGHHVSYPGGRVLVVVPVRIELEYDPR